MLKGEKVGIYAGLTMSKKKLKISDRKRGIKKRKEAEDGLEYFRNHSWKLEKNIITGWLTWEPLNPTKRKSVYDE